MRIFKVNYNYFVTAFLILGLVIPSFVFADIDHSDNILSTRVGTSTVATTTAYTFLGDTPVATTEKAGTGTPVTHYTHVDHLGSTSAVTDTAGTTVETVDYNPYGPVKTTTGTYSPQRQYIGQYYDTDTSLSYLNARYYDGERGQFVSQDPVFWEIGLTGDGKNALLNPQSQNSYSYANDNPINNKDSNGRFAQLLLGAGAGIVGQYGSDVYNNIQANGFSGSAFISNLSSGETYLTRAAQGVAVTLTGGAVASFGVASQATAVGIASGISGAGGNYILGQTITPQSVAIDTILGGLTFGAVKSTQAVSGRLPKVGTEAFFVGKHTQQSATSLGIDSIASYTSSLLGGVSLSGNSGNKSNTSTISGSQNSNSSASLKTKNKQ